MLRPTNPTQIRNRILHPIDRQSVREGFAPFTATVPLGTNDTPSELDRRLIKSGITVEDGKWNPPSLCGNTQRSRGRGASRLLSIERTTVPASFWLQELNHCSGTVHKRVRYNLQEVFGEAETLAPFPLHKTFTLSTHLVSTDILCGSFGSRAGRSLRPRRPAIACLRRLRPAYNHNVRTLLSPVGLDGMAGRLRHAYNHNTDPTGLIKSNGSVADAVSCSPCRGRRPLSHRRSAGHPPDR